MIVITNLINSHWNFNQRFLIGTYLRNFADYMAKVENFNVRN